MLGYVSDAALAELYRRCAVFCYPSLGEGFGLPVLEAMAAGAAVLTSNVSSLPEVGGEAVEYADPTGRGEHRRRAASAARPRAPRARSWPRGHGRARPSSRGSASRRSRSKRSTAPSPAVAPSLPAPRLSAMPRILLLTTDHEDYLADSLLHGLRTLLGADVVDFPKVEFLYDSYPVERRQALYGHGFSLYGLLPDVSVDRDGALERARDGEFDLVVFADIWSTFERFAALAPSLRGVPMAVLDGADRQEPYPYAGLWWRRPKWWLLPRAHARAIYFKRELTPVTGWFRSYLLLPPVLAERLPSIRRMREIAFSIPAEKLLSEPYPAKRQLLASHVVDAEVAARLGVGTSYAFSDEAAYYADLQASRFGITVKRAGWDCLRHYEQAANGCVPCFRDLERKPPRCAPHGLDDTNCVNYHDADELMARLEAIDDAQYESLRRGALAWARANTTAHRAERFLSDCGLPIASRPAATSEHDAALEQPSRP